MNRLILVLLIALTPLTRGFSLSKGSILQFEHITRSFGFVKEGTIAEFQYTFKNTGTEPVLITEIKVGCPCTTFDYPKTPVLPGQSGVIKVKFDTKNKMDRQDRTFEVHTTDSGSPYTLRFKGVVLKNKN